MVLEENKRKEIIQVLRKMNKKLLLLIGLFVIILAGTASVFVSKKLLTSQKTHYHAGFIVFQNNKKLSFSDFKYMYEKPCTLKGKEDKTNENDQLEKAHLHDNVGDVIHIERSGAHWKDLFTNINYPINYGKATGYINGQKANNFQNLHINPDDSLVLFIGSNDVKADLLQAPTKEYIEQMGKKSKTCGD